MRPKLTFYVAGIPKAQPRTKARAFGKFAQVYTPKTADDWKMIVRHEATKAWQASGNVTPWTGPLCVNLTFYMPRPKSHFNGKGLIKPNAPKWHTSKPDVDNAMKAVFDAITNTGLWTDDALIVQTSIKKLYAVYGMVCTIAPGCEIEISEAQP